MLEVKTTDAYRISLDNIAEYREKLIAAGNIGKASSILIVVGREDTGELEAQVRGSRHAWDIRLLSTEALLKLVANSRKMPKARRRALKFGAFLAPMEYTRLDKMIDVMFTAAKNLEAAATAIEEEDIEQEEPKGRQVQEKGLWQFTEPELLQAKRDQILSAIAKQITTIYIKKSRALFWDAKHEDRLVCTLSKHIRRRDLYAYWYAYHPHLKEGKRGFLALGCMDLPFAFVIPVAVV